MEETSGTDEFVTRRECELHRTFTDGRICALEGDLREMKVVINNISTALEKKKDVDDARYKESKDREIWILVAVIVALIGILMGRGIDLGWFL